MNKKSFLLSFLCVSLVNSDTQAHSPIFIEKLNRGTMAAASFLLAGFYFMGGQKKIAQMVVDVNKNHIFNVLSDRSKNWMRDILRERGIPEKDVEDIQFISDINFLDEMIACVIEGTCYRYVYIATNLAGELNSLLEKDVLTESEQQKLDALKFIIGHEAIHIKKSYESGFSAIRGDSLAIQVVASFAAWGTYELLRYNDFSSFNAKVISNVIFLFSFYQSTKHCIEEERECDLRASEDVAVLKAGADFCEKKDASTIESVCKALDGFVSAETVVKMYRKYPTLVAVLTLHPRSDIRAAYVRARAQELECVQASAHAA